IELLRDYLSSLKVDASNLYQYGRLVIVLNQFNGLSATEQRRLIALAVNMGDQDVQNVARHLLQKVEPTMSETSVASDLLSEEDRREICIYCEQSGPSLTDPQIAAMVEREIRLMIKEMAE